MSRIEPATLAAAWQDGLARYTSGGAGWDQMSQSAKDSRIKTARTVIEALSLARFDMDAEDLSRADPRGLAILWQVKLSETGPGVAPWDELTPTMQAQRVAAARKVLTALREASPAAVEPTPYAWGKLTVESVREMLTMAKDAQIEYHDNACQSASAADLDAYNCDSGKGCDKQMVKLDHCLEQLPAPAPVEPKTPGTVARIVVNPETNEIQWFRRLDLSSPIGGGPWATFGVAGGIPWSHVVEIAQRHGVTVEIVHVPSA